MSSSLFFTGAQVQKASVAAEEEHNEMKSELHRLADLTQDFYSRVSSVLPNK